MRPTTRDLAKAAGVSLATVDRVLNGRSGVHRSTVEAVTEAIERIGFVRNIQAANLARKRSYRFDFLLPRAGDEFMSRVVDEIAAARIVFAAESVVVNCRQVLNDDPHNTARLLAGILADDVDGVAIMAPESPQVRDATKRLRERGVQVVQFVSGQAGTYPFDFVGVDNHAAGATAGQLIGRFLGGRSGAVLVVSETMNALDSAERRLGFDSVLTSGFPGLIALPSLETHGDDERTRAVIRTALHARPDIVGVYILASEARLPLEAIRAFSDPAGLVIIAHERTAHTERMLECGVLDALIVQNAGHLVRSAIRVLRAGSDGFEPVASQERIRIEILIKENL